MRYFIKRNKTLLILLIAMIPVWQPVAAEPENPAGKPSARDIFVEMQTPALEVLKRSTRLDMLDYWDVDSIYSANNAVQGKSQLIAVAPNYLKVQVSPVSTYEIKILPIKKRDIIMAIWSVGGESQAVDSEIAFYDLEMNPVAPKEIFKAPELKDFFELPKGSAVTMKEISEIIPFSTIEYSSDPESDVVKARLTVGDFMNKEDYDKIKPLLKEVEVRIGN